MLRGISVGTGLSYEVVSRNYSGTSYSSSRTSMLEDRRRFRRWQRYDVQHMCQPIWDAFCDQAATAGVDGFPSMAEILADRRAATAVEWQTPAWEWVDPQNEQAASVSAIENNMSTLQRECAKLGINWREVLRQRHKERKAEAEYGVQPIAVQEAEAEIAATTGEMPTSAGGLKGMGRQGFKNTDKAMDDILFGLKNGTKTETQARVLLSEIGLSDSTISQLLADAMDDGILNGSATE
jgi:capsid protein